LRRLLHSVPIVGIVFQYQDILFEQVHLHLRFRKKILEELFIARIEIIAHIALILSIHPISSSVRIKVPFGSFDNKEEPNELRKRRATWMVTGLRTR
jgi:hypothetical protein